MEIFVPEMKEINTGISKPHPKGKEREKPKPDPGIRWRLCSKKSLIPFGALKQK